MLIGKRETGGSYVGSVRSSPRRRVSGPKPPAHSGGILAVRAQMLIVKTVTLNCCRSPLVWHAAGETTSV